MYLSQTSNLLRFSFFFVPFIFDFTTIHFYHHSRMIPYCVIILDQIDFSALRLLLLFLKVRLEMLLSLHGVQIILGPTKAFYFSHPLRQSYNTVSSSQSLEPGISELSTVAILAVPRRNLNLSLLVHMKMYDFFSACPSAEKCAAVITLNFFKCTAVCTPTSNLNPLQTQLIRGFL